MRLLLVFCLVLTASCAHEKARAPASANGNPVAYDSLAAGNVKASAVKRVENKNVCFDVNLVMTGVSQEEAASSNWTMAWVDKNDQYHLLPNKQRDPASVPQGGNVVAPYGAYKEWQNSFTTCAPEARANQVKSLVLTPKNLPYDKEDGLKLNWQ